MPVPGALGVAPLAVGYGVGVRLRAPVDGRGEHPRRRALVAAVPRGRARRGLIRVSVEMLAIPFTEHSLHYEERMWLLVSGRDPATDQYQVVQVGCTQEKLDVFAAAEDADRYVDQFSRCDAWTICGTPLIVDTRTFCPHEADGIRSWAAQMYALLSQVEYHGPDGSRWAVSPVVHAVGPPRITRLDYPHHEYVPKLRWGGGAC